MALSAAPHWPSVSRTSCLPQKRAQVRSSFLSLFFVFVFENAYDVGWFSCFSVGFCILFDFDVLGNYMYHSLT